MTLTRQEIFDIAAKHLLTQNDKSKVNPTHQSCLYRGPNGLMCAIGPLIPDSLYTPKMEGSSIGGLMMRDEKIYKLLGGDSNINFLGELQTIHDFRLVEDWRIELCEFAGRWNLSARVIDQV